MYVDASSPYLLSYPKKVYERSKQYKKEDLPQAFSIDVRGTSIPCLFIQHFSFSERSEILKFVRRLSFLFGGLTKKQCNSNVIKCKSIKELKSKL